MNDDKERLLRLADQEDGCPIAVGGLTHKSTFPDIETVYRVRIEFWFDEDFYPYPNEGKHSRSEQVNDYAFEITKNDQDIGVSNSNGGPCWNAYLEMEAFDRELLRRYTKAIITYLKRFKGYHYE